MDKGIPETDTAIKILIPFMENPYIWKSLMVALLKLNDCLIKT